MTGREKFVRWVKRWWKTTLGILFALAAAGAGVYGAFWGNFAAEADRMGYFLIGVAGVLGAALLPILDSIRSNKEILQLKEDLKTEEAKTVRVEKEALKKGRADFIFVLDKAVQPLLRKLGPVIRARYTADRELHAAKLQQAAVFALLRVIDPENPTMRANYFKMKHPVLPSGYLVAESTTGSLPRSVFKINDVTQPYSQAIRKMMAEDSYIVSKDTSVDPPPGFGPSSNHTYKSFVSAPATDGVGVDGMITIDSPDAGALDGADESLVRLIGTIVALSETVRDGKKPEDVY